MYIYTQANDYSVSVLVKRPRCRWVIAQLVAIRGGGVISRTPREPERAPPAQWIRSLRYSLFFSFHALAVASSRSARTGWRAERLLCSNFCCALTASLIPLRRPGVCGILSPSVHASAASCPPPSMCLRPLVPLGPGFRGLRPPSSRSASAASRASFFRYCFNCCSGVVSSSTSSSPALYPRRRLRRLP